MSLFDLLGTCVHIRISKPMSSPPLILTFDQTEAYFLPYLISLALKGVDMEAFLKTFCQAIGNAKERRTLKPLRLYKVHAAMQLLCKKKCTPRCTKMNS